ncbi:MAG: DUF2029 domain-containing protein [Oscillospiraceae bacterium]|nr:DUF2029 domain-containing protein [Oscillospiraceae bacterium]
MTIPYFCLLVIAALGYLILWHEGLLREKAAIFLSAALLLAAMALRAAMLPHETLDYQDFLTRWVDYFRQNGGFYALRRSVGNYNVPYLYFLAFFSYLPLRDLYLIKLLSILFDLLLAWGVLRLVSRFQRGDTARLLAFFLTLFLPTVLLNGAYWGQCDSIYVAFAVWSLVFILEDKPIRGVAAIALSFAFKLQAVFLMPAFLVFLFAKKLKWWHLAFFPLTYLIIVLPCVLLGRPLTDVLLLYFNQADTVGSALNYNSASMYALFRNAANPEEAAKLGIAAAFAFLLAVYTLCWFRRKRLNQRALLTVSVLICLAVPFLLPHMHDRYFFMADVLTLACAFVSPALAPMPVLTSFGSLMGYHAYLTMRWFLDKPQSMAWGACALLAVTVTLCLDLVRRLCAPMEKVKKSG